MTVGKNESAVPCGVWDCHMHMGNTGMFSGVTVTFKYRYNILQIPFSVLLPHPVTLEFILKPFIKLHLRSKIPVVNASRTLAVQ